MVSFIIYHRFEELHDCPAVRISSAPSDLAAACGSCASHISPRGAVAAAQVHYPYLNARYASPQRRITWSDDADTPDNALNLAAAAEMDCSRAEDVT